MKVDFYKLAKKYRPRNWRVVHRDPVSRREGQEWVLLWGEVVYTSKTLYCPPLDTSYAFLVYLHEVAHVRLRHGQRDIPCWREEYEAERWAIATARKEGVRVSREYLRHAKENVRRRYALEKTTAQPDELYWMYGTRGRK